MIILIIKDRLGVETQFKPKDEIAAQAMKDLAESYGCTVTERKWSR